MQNTISKMLSSISMEDDLCPFLVGERWSRRDYIFIYLNSINLFVLLIPHKYPCLFHSFISLPKVILKALLTFTLVEVTFYSLLLHLRYVDPSGIVFRMVGLPKNIILQNFLVFVLRKDGVKRIGLLNSALFVIV